MVGWMDDDMVIEDEIVSIPCKQTFSINKHENFQTSAQRKFRLASCQHKKFCLYMQPRQEKIFCVLSLISVYIDRGTEWTHIAGDDVEKSMMMVMSKLMLMVTNKINSSWAACSIECTHIVRAHFPLYMCEHLKLCWLNWLTCVVMDVHVQYSGVYINAASELWWADLCILFVLIHRWRIQCLHFCLLWWKTRTMDLVKCFKILVCIINSSCIIITITFLIYGVSSQHKIRTLGS